MMTLHMLCIPLHTRRMACLVAIPSIIGSVSATYLYSKTRIGEMSFSMFEEVYIPNSAKSKSSIFANEGKPEIRFLRLQWTCMRTLQPGIYEPIPPPPLIFVYFHEFFFYLFFIIN